MTDTLENLQLGRRSFLRMGLTGTAALAAGGTALLVPSDEAVAAEMLLKTEHASAGAGPRTLSFRNLHTLEELTVTYWRDGAYDPAALNEINYVLRDFRTGDIHPIDRGVLNILNLVRKRVGTSEPVNIVSGYRSPKTNASLRRSGDGVAQRSYHLKGMAVDLRLPGISTYGIARTARGMGMGGVGYYSSSDFVHLDAGPYRTW